MYFIKYLRLLALIGMILGIIGLVFMPTYSPNAASQYYIDRIQLLSDIEKAIGNGADLQDVKQLYENRNYTRRYLMSGFLSGDPEKSFYQEPLALSTVLKDLRAEMFLRTEVNEELATKIKQFIVEHEKTNPFDKLETTQRLHFETIQSKMGSNYNHIQHDVNLIVDQLAEKNQLVEKYLKDATLGLRLSIIALIVGVISLIPQVFSTWQSIRQKKDKI